VQHAHSIVLCMAVYMLSSSSNNSIAADLFHRDRNMHVLMFMC